MLSHSTQGSAGGLLLTVLFIFFLSVPGLGFSPKRIGLTRFMKYQAFFKKKKKQAHNVEMSVQAMQ